MAANTHLATLCAAAAVGIFAATAAGSPATATPQAGPRTARIPILMYHRIGTAGASAPVATRHLTVDRGTFEQQMRWLRRSGYRTLTQRQLYDAVALGKP